MGKYMHKSLWWTRRECVQAAESEQVWLEHKEQQEVGREMGW